MKVMHWFFILFIANFYVLPFLAIKVDSSNLFPKDFFDAIELFNRKILFKENKWNISQKHQQELFIDTHSILSYLNNAIKSIDFVESINITQPCYVQVLKLIEGVSAEYEWAIKSKV